MGALYKPRRQPAIDQIHEGFECFGIGPANGIAKGVEREGVRIGQLGKQIENTLAQCQS